MSDYDYGRENGLWGNEGIPYAVKYESRSSYLSARKSNSKNFNRRERLSLKNGFEIVYDEDAYNGRYFVKDGKKWIHNIAALKRQLGTRNDNELINLGYDVENHHLSH